MRRPPIFTVWFPARSTLKRGYGVFQTLVRGSRSYSKCPKKWNLSRMIGPPSVNATCWLSIGTTRLRTGFLALKRLSRKLPRIDPESALVPDRVMAITCTAVERPIVASKRLEMNWNSAIESWL